MTSTDHKVVGNMYLVTSFLFFGTAGIMALVIRAPRPATRVSEALTAVGAPVIGRSRRSGRDTRCSPNELVRRHRTLVQQVSFA